MKINEWIEYNDCWIAVGENGKYYIVDQISGETFAKRDTLESAKEYRDTQLEQKKPPLKSAEAKRVLQLMDSFDDGNGRYTEFVQQVSNETNISVEELNKELEPFI